MEFVKEQEECVDEEEEEDEGVRVEIEAKWRKEVFSFESVDMNCTCVRDLKMLLSEETCIPVKRIKLLGPFGSAGTSDNDVIMLNQFEKKLKNNNKFIITVMGTPDTELTAFEQGSEKASDGILNDFGHNFTPASAEWHNLKRFTDSLDINFIEKPRPGKKLLVLDLDHTILDFSSKGTVSPSQMKRPYMDLFLETVYESYDICIWSQTHWRWVEIKLVELGIIHNPKFQLCFMLDKSSMFRSGSKNEYIKPLHIIWSKFPDVWGRHNTLHIDDLRRNFAMNPENGIVCSAFYRDGSKKKKNISANSEGLAKFGDDADCELLLLARYLVHMATANDVSKHNHLNWRERAGELLQEGDVSSKESNDNANLKRST